MLPRPFPAAFPSPRPALLRSWRRRVSPTPRRVWPLRGIALFRSCAAGLVRPPAKGRAAPVPAAFLRACRPAGLARPVLRQMAFTSAIENGRGSGCSPVRRADRCAAVLGCRAGLSPLFNRDSKRALEWPGRQRAKWQSVQGRFCDLTALPSAGPAVQLRPGRQKEPKVLLYQGLRLFHFGGARPSGRACAHGSGGAGGGHPESALRLPSLPAGLPPAGDPPGKRPACCRTGAQAPAPRGSFQR